jgi:nucleoid DNA-binding protein
VQVHGLGVFEVVQRAAKVGHNPRTGQRVDIPARRAVRFKPARSLRGAVA